MLDYRSPDRFGYLPMPIRPFRVLLKQKRRPLQKRAQKPKPSRAIPLDVEPTSIGRLARSPVERGPRAADQVYRSLRRSIILGELTPGTRLREVEVAMALQVSRTPVREAVSRLIGDRLVRELPTGGVEVVDASAEIFEIFHIREALEGCAARLAATRISDDELAKLDRLIEEAERIHHSAVDDRLRNNNDFHLTIAKASGSQRLVDMIGGFREFFMNVEWQDRHDQKKSAKLSLHDHREILAALHARSSDQVEQFVRQHLRRVYTKLLSDRRKPV
jgi:DNA-binding GntR family transcriptional regulator